MDDNLYGGDLGEDTTATDDRTDTTFDVNTPDAVDTPGDVTDESGESSEVKSEETQTQALLKRFIVKAQDKGDYERAEALQAELDSQ